MNQHNPSSLITIDPCADGIRPHRCIQHIPPWADDSPRMEALRRELMTTGICQPVQMTPKHEIVDADSRERWRAARMLQLGSIPVVVVPPDQAVTACLNALVHRRHLTKSALAYLAWPILELALDESRDRRHQNLRKGQCSPENELSSRSAKTATELAEEHGFNRHFIFDAKKVHALFEKHENERFDFQIKGGAEDGGTKELTLREYYEPRILREPIGGEHEDNRAMGLGPALAGIQSTISGDRDKFSSKKHGQLELFGKGLDTFCIRAAAIDEPEARRAAREALSKIEDAAALERIRSASAALQAEAKARIKELEQEA